MESHGGKIQALNADVDRQTGAVIRLSFKSGTPPVLELHE
jgi:nitrogen fixation/metabolism regulation signal transduction histidine kinase